MWMCVYVFVFLDVLYESNRWLHCDKRSSSDFICEESNKHEIESSWKTSVKFYPQMTYGFVLYIEISQLMFFFKLKFLIDSKIKINLDITCRAIQRWWRKCKKYWKAGKIIQSDLEIYSLFGRFSILVIEKKSTILLIYNSTCQPTIYTSMNTIKYL